MQYIVIDLEWNGSYSKKAHGYFNEIIEVGAVKVDEQMRIMDTFRAAIKPVVSKKLSSIVTVKLDALEELVEEAGGDPVLVLYAYKHDAERIRQRIKCRSLDTSADIDAWNRGEIPVALAHPASIGHGLNLQEGGHITIWYGMTWSLELYQQANERLNRPGQTQVCRVYHLILQGTHDERVLKALQNKEEGQAAAIEALRLEIVKED